MPKWKRRKYWKAVWFLYRTFWRATCMPVPTHAAVCINTDSVLSISACPSPTRSFLSSTIFDNFRQWSLSRWHQKQVSPLVKEAFPPLPVIFSRNQHWEHSFTEKCFNACLAFNNLTFYTSQKAAGYSRNTRSQKTTSDVWYFFSYLNDGITVSTWQFIPDVCLDPCKPSGLVSQCSWISSGTMFEVMSNTGLTTRIKQ